MKAKYCIVCNNTFRGSRRKHFRSKHQKCKTCNKWGDYLNEHCSIICSVCQERTCNIRLHLRLCHYFKCPDCLRYFKHESDHPLVECSQCNAKVCNLNHHLAVFINCRNNELLGSNVPIKKAIKFIFVKCESCKMGDGKESCKCYRYPLT